MFKKLLAFSLLLLFVSQGFAGFRPPPDSGFFPQDDKQTKKKLPPRQYIRSRDYDMRHIALDLRFDWEKEQTFGTATITLAPLVTNFRSVKLDAGAMIINSVKLNGKDLNFAYDEPKMLLSVELEKVYAIGESVTFVVDYRTKGGVVSNTLGFGAGGGLKFVKPTAENPNKRKQIWSQGETDYNRFWFPGYDSPNDFATNELTATVEKPLMVISNGKLVKRTDNKNGTETFHWKMETPHANYLTSIVVGEYAEVKGAYAGIPVSTFIYPNELKDGAISVAPLPAMVKFFSEKTGVKYPYVKYAQVVAEEFNGGMENITATTMTPALIHDERELIDIDNYGLQAHELAHQWFGDYVTCREWGQIWLNESFATYFQALWDEESRGYDEFLYRNVLSNQQSYLSAWNQNQRRPIVTQYYADKDALFDTYAYPRGAAVLHMLRKHLGDELFFKSLNRYLTTNANKPVETGQLRIAIEETTGQSMDWFFDQWLYKMGHPVFEVTKSYQNGKLTLNVKQTQKIDIFNEYPQVEFFQTYVDIAIDNEIKRVWIEPKAENIFTFDTATEPKLVSFDYQGALIKELKFEKTTDELTYQIKNDKDVLGRVGALKELGVRLRSEKMEPSDKSKIREALNTVIAGDAFWAMRRDAIQIIVPPPGNTNPAAVNLPDSTIAVLNNAARDKSSAVRAAAIFGLGLRRDPKYAPNFVSALNDRSYSVIDSAAIALARTKDAAAYDALTKLLETPSWKDRIRIAALNGLAVLGDPRALDIGFKYADKSYASGVRTIALNVLAATGKGNEKVYPLLLESFKISLANNDFQGIFNGFQGFIRLADPRGQEAFDLAKEKFKTSQNILGFVNQLEAQFKKALQDNK